jgi:hypothetical protein
MYDISGGNPNIMGIYKISLLKWSGAHPEVGNLTKYSDNGTYV